MSDDTWWLDFGELDDQQKEIITLPQTGSYLLLGPPGSGKTNLLLLRAQYLVGAGRPNLFVLMFTRALREFAIRGAGHYQLDPDKLQTFHVFGLRFLNEHGVSISKETRLNPDARSPRRSTRSYARSRA